MSLLTIIANDLNRSTFFYFSLYIPIALGIIPRESAWLLLLLFIYVTWVKKTKTALLLFVRLIPFFIALPITATFDNFNLWRVCVIILCIGSLIESRAFLSIIAFLKQPFTLAFIKRYSLECAVAGFLLWSFFTLAAATDFGIGVKKIIFFANALLLLFPLAHHLKHTKDFLIELSESISFSGIAIIVGGFLQQALAFSIPINVFQHFWGETISKNLYGINWSNIVMNFGNTWYSYPPDTTPRLRVFSVFPDSHTFPMYLIMVLPFAVVTLREKTNHGKKIILMLVSSLTGIIASGTRGIWLSLVVPLGILLYTGVIRQQQFARRCLKLFFPILIASFGLVYLFYTIPQFLSFNEGIKKDALTHRLSTLLSFEETSNKGRLHIWKETIRSVSENPWMGVGIANFPVVLNEPLAQAKAGSTAHNLYLNALAETGIIGGLLFIFIVLELFRRSYLIYQQSNPSALQPLDYLLMCSLAWLYTYSLTDAALLDERTLLLFIVLATTITALWRQSSRESKVRSLAYKL